MRILGLIGAAGLVLASSAAAEGTAGEALRSIDRGDAAGHVVKMWLAGNVNGMGWANGHLKSQGKPPLWCEPQATTTDQDVAILREFLRRNPDHADRQAGLVVLRAMQSVFPCPQE